VPETGIEPAHPCGRQILSLLRLPISPLGQRGAILSFLGQLLSKETDNFLLAATLFGDKYLPDSSYYFFYDVHRMNMQVANFRLDSDVNF
jgi:hypothetical protein